MGYKSHIGLEGFITRCQLLFVHPVTMSVSLPPKRMGHKSHIGRESLFCLKIKLHPSHIWRKKNPIISGKAEKDITAKGGFIWSLRWILYDIYLEISYGEANDQLTLVHRQNLNHNPKKKMGSGEPKCQLINCKQGHKIRPLGGSRLLLHPEGTLV